MNEVTPKSQTLLRSGKSTSHVSVVIFWCGIFVSKRLRNLFGATFPIRPLYELYLRLFLVKEVISMLFPQALY